jgi:hypothetical protein
MIHATPPEKRGRFGKEIRRLRRARGTTGRRERCHFKVQPCPPG